MDREYSWYGINQVRSIGNELLLQRRTSVDNIKANDSKVAREVDRWAELLKTVSNSVLLLTREVTGLRFGRVQRVRGGS
jgi:hypothetical protein